jgi:DNA-directed RNA polymerase subunit H (RpoH/RPB5)
MDYNKIFNVCKELFETRGYDITGESVIEWYIKNSKTHLYLIMDKLNTDIIKKYYILLQKDDIKHAILVYHNNVTPSVKKIIQSIDINIELFSMAELHYNVLKHVMVPKHTKIRNIGKNNTDKYPVLKRTDPVSRFMGYKHGDIIRIDRNDGSISYRYVK